ncbi:hypothetical protein EBR57_09795 [bacterium]|nr:hypothetical protein [bacterium]
MAPESEEDKKAAATGVVPVWDHVHVGTYHNGNTASQITPRFITNYLIMLHHSSSDMKDLLAHPTVIEAVKKIMQNPELYHPRESVGDPEHFSEGLETSAAEQELPAEAPESPPPSMPKMTEPISRVRPAGLSGARPSSSTGGASVPPSTTPPTRPTPPVEDLEDFRASLHEHLL